ncbi:MAG TPA: Hpt domain-containing protein, partial [bacterium]|nr:Hpt domain-containing protein [bacterium]
AKRATIVARFVIPVRRSVEDAERVEADRGPTRGGTHHDGDRVRRAAHSLKGMAGNFSARAVIATANQLEDAGQSGDMSCAPGLLARLESDLRELKNALLDLKEEYQNSTPVY